MSQFPNRKLLITTLDSSSSSSSSGGGSKAQLFLSDYSRCLLVDDLCLERGVQPSLTPGAGGAAVVGPCSKERCLLDQYKPSALNKTITVLWLLLLLCIIAAVMVASSDTKTKLASRHHNGWTMTVLKKIFVIYVYSFYAVL